MKININTQKTVSDTDTQLSKKYLEPVFKLK